MLFLSMSYTLIKADLLEKTPTATQEINRNSSEVLNYGEGSQCPTSDLFV